VAAVHCALGRCIAALYFQRLHNNNSSQLAAALCRTLSATCGLSVVCAATLPLLQMQEVADAAADSDTLDKKKKKPAKAPATCADNKDKRDCTKLGSEEGECAWCEGGYMPASCMSAMAAKYLPETVAKCTLPKEKKVRRSSS
jgi:hypothetical protein